MTQRRFLFLQGPIGPFFKELANSLTEKGHTVEKINLFGGDQIFFRNGTPFKGKLSEWNQFLLRFCKGKGFTDLVLFGDRRKYHEQAIETLAEAISGLRVWVFEEGYFRPNWITLDSYGVNVRSALPNSAVALLNELSRENNRDSRAVGATRIHPWIKKFAPDVIKYYGAAAALANEYPDFQYHRESTFTEALGYAKSHISTWLSPEDGGAIADLVGDAGKRFFLVALQLEGDSQIRKYSRFKKRKNLIEHVISSFAKYGRDDDCLLFKSHPYESNWLTAKKEVRAIADAHGVGDRVLFCHQCDLPRLLDRTAGVITVNSTAALSAIEKGVPVKAVGEAFWNFSPLTDTANINQFWHTPTAPDIALFAEFRKLIMARTQFNGNFYSKQGRESCLDEVSEALASWEQDVSRLSAPALHRLNEARAKRIADLKSTQVTPKKIDLSL